MKNTSQITIERESNFGQMTVGTEKELLIEVRNIDDIDHLLYDTRFLNVKSNFEVRDQSFPVIVPTVGSVVVTVFFK